MAKPKEDVAPKKKKVNVEFLDPKPGRGKKRHEVYDLINSLIETHHSHLAEAKITVFFNIGWNEDTDGRIKLGHASKGTDKLRLSADTDFVIELNKQFWEEMPEHREALLDHELCHCEVQKNKHGEPKEDENGRIVYRMRKHDVEEFSEIIARHGTWKSDLEVFFEAAKRGGKMPLFPEQGKDKPKPTRRTRNKGAAAKKPPAADPHTN